MQKYRIIQKLIGVSTCVHCLQTAFHAKHNINVSESLEKIY